MRIPGESGLSPLQRVTLLLSLHGMQRERVALSVDGQHDKPVLTDRELLFHDSARQQPRLALLLPHSPRN
jgi:hypothetical protein